MNDVAIARKPPATRLAHKVRFVTAARIFAPEDGQRLGLQGMINAVVTACASDLAKDLPAELSLLQSGDPQARARALARFITGLEAEAFPPKLRDELLRAAEASRAPVL